MAKKITYPYEPDYAVPPGETLAETLDALGVSQADLARRTGLHVKTINEIIKGKAPITAETAQLFECVLNVPARLWNNLEINYRQSLARFEETKRLRSHAEWLKEEGIPVKAMIKAGCVVKCEDEADQTREVYGYLGVTSPQSFRQTYGSLQPDFRKSTKFDCNFGSLAVWLRMGEIEAQKIECGTYSKDGFLNVLETIRGLSCQPPAEFLPEIQEICAPVGVVVAYVPGLPKCPVSGASRWVSPDKALIQLSGRFRKDDHFWFTFFHEAGHIVLHRRDSKKIIFLDDDSHGTEDRKEMHANRFAANKLINPGAFKELREYCAAGSLGAEAIIQFADKLGIAPGIIVGRLQHEGLISFKSILNRLKRDVVIG